MVDIAVYSQDSPVPISAIAERQNISVRYLEQLLPKLKKAGIIKSIRGAQGGYMLDKDPKDISAGDILRTLEGDLTPIDCAAFTGDTSPPQFPHTPHILPHYPNWHHLPHSLIYQSLIIHYLILARALIFN